MTATTHSASKRLAALLLLVALPLALLLLTAFNAIRIADLGTLSASAEEQLARFEQRARRAGTSPAAAQDFSVLFVEAASRSLAEAALQRRIVDAIEAASSRVIESGAADVPDAENGDGIEVRATLDTDNDRLLRFLHAIETGLPLLSVEELAIRRLQEDDAKTGGELDLRVDIRIRGHWRSVTP